MTIPKLKLHPSDNHMFESTPLLESVNTQYNILKYAEGIVIGGEPNPAISVESITLIVWITNIQRVRLFLIMVIYRETPLTPH